MTDGAATQYGFPQYDAPARAASRQLGFKVGKAHETVALTRGRDGADAYEAIANTAYLKQAAANAMKIRVGEIETNPGGAKVHEVDAKR